MCITLQKYNIFRKLHHQKHKKTRFLAFLHTVHSHNCYFIVNFAIEKKLLLMKSKIRIKDIAERAGVSVGTVDRVLHKRPNVSKTALEKVEKALEEMNYQPNAYASALAYNKSFHFYFFLPWHSFEAYWDEVEDGAHKAETYRADFHINVEFVYYRRFEEESFEAEAQKIIEANPDGVVVVPSTLEKTRMLTNVLHERNIPFVMLDSYMPDLQPLAFFGQDSFASGYFAAKMFMLLANQEKQVMLMRHIHDGKFSSKQQANREVGFRHYMLDHYPEIEIVQLDMPTDTSRKKYDSLLDAFFQKYPNIHHCITLNARAHTIGDYLLRQNKRNCQVMGYDMVPKNVECLRRGSVSFLIAQHAYQQGYECIDALFRAVVLKQKVEPVNYMPIELITKENYTFYKR